MSRQIMITAAAVSPELTAKASTEIMRKFGGYTRADGHGGYTFQDGRASEQPSVLWFIGINTDTAVTRADVWGFVAQWAEAYCSEGGQESVYFQDADGETYLAFGNGRITPLD